MTVSEIDVDPRGRASMKSAGVQPGRYRVTVEESGSVTLDPVRSFTRAELLALNDEQVRAKFSALHRGELETVTSNKRP